VGGPETATAAIAHVKESGRGWQSLFDVFSEATAYGYLKRAGYTGIRFIPRSQVKTPDPRAIQNGRRALCEVKAVNISQEEASRRQRVANGEIFVTETSSEVGNRFLAKVTRKLGEAIEQLDAADPSVEAQRSVFALLRFDDWVATTIRNISRS
jgi:hypothetical protein